MDWYECPKCENYVGVLKGAAIYVYCGKCNRKMSECDKKTANKNKKK